METTDWQKLSKKERRRLKKEQKRLGREREFKRGRLMKWGLVFGFIIFLAASLFLFNFLNEKRYENAPKIQAIPLSHDFGQVAASEGKVETSFEVKSAGNAPLVITGMETSCGCTKAKLKIKNEKSKIVEGPEFGMHGNPTDWSVSLEPQGIAELVVIFDPSFHEVFGPVTRTVSVFSNDPGRSEEKVTIYADVQS